MSKSKSLLKTIKNNRVELWLALLLFVAFPYVVSLYTDWRGFMLASVIAQTVVLGLFIYKGNK